MDPIYIPLFGFGLALLIAAGAVWFFVRLVNGKPEPKLKKSIADIRQQGKYYRVQETMHLFGHFDDDLFQRDEGYYTKTVFALSPQQAVKRFCKRNCAELDTKFTVTSERWGKYRVCPIDTPYKRHYIYYY